MFETSKLNQIDDVLSLFGGGRLSPQKLAALRAKARKASPGIKFYPTAAQRRRGAGFQAR